MYLAVTNEDPDDELKIVVDTCFASNSPDPNDRNIQYMFLYENCPYDDTYRSLKIGYHQFGFQISAFVFIRMQSLVSNFNVSLLSHSNYHFDAFYTLILIIRVGPIVSLLIILKQNIKEPKTCKTNSKAI